MKFKNYRMTLNGPVSSGTQQVETATEFTTDPVEKAGYYWVLREGEFVIYHLGKGNEAYLRSVKPPGMPRPKRGDMFTRYDGTQCAHTDPGYYRTYGLPSDHLIHTLTGNEGAISWRTDIPPYGSGNLLVRRKDGSVEVKFYDHPAGQWQDGIEVTEWKKIPR